MEGLASLEKVKSKTPKRSGAFLLSHAGYCVQLSAVGLMPSSYPVHRVYLMLNVFLSCSASHAPLARRGRVPIAACDFSLAFTRIKFSRSGVNDSDRTSTIFAMLIE